MNYKKELINLLELLEFEKVIDETIGIIYTKYYPHSKMQYIFQTDNELILSKYFFYDKEGLNVSECRDPSLILEAVKIAFKYEIRKYKISKFLLKR